MLVNLQLIDIALAKSDKEVKASFWQNAEVYRKPEQAYIETYLHGNPLAKTFSYGPSPSQPRFTKLYKM